MEIKNVPNKMLSVGGEVMKLLSIPNSVYFVSVIYAVGVNLYKISDDKNIN